MKRALVTALIYSALSIGASEAQDNMPSLDVRGLVDARLILTDNTVSWEESGLGKTRWGGDSSGDGQFLGRIAEASLIFLPKFNWDW